MFFGLIVWGSYEPALHAWNSGEFEGEGALRVPVWPARFVVMFGALLVTRQLSRAGGQRPPSRLVRARRARTRRQRATLAEEPL